MKRYKEFRMTIVLAVLTVGMTGLSLYCGMIGQRSRLIIGLIMSGMMLILTATRYNLSLEDTCMLVYEWKIAAMLPSVIDYDDVSHVEVMGKHKVKIIHRVISYVYVFNAADFTAQLQQLMAAYRQKKGL